jgi:hypothetical protein
MTLGGTGIGMNYKPDGFSEQPLMAAHQAGYKVGYTAGIKKALEEVEKHFGYPATCNCEECTQWSVIKKKLEGV